MEVLTALSLAATDPFWTNDCEVCDWPRAEAAAAAIALSDAPHCAVAVALNAINSTDRAASLTNVMLSIILTILLLPLLLAIFLFIPFLLRDEICDLVNQISPSSDQLVAVVVTCMLARPRLARMLRLLLFFALLTNAQIAQETSNDNRAASGHEAFARME